MERINKASKISNDLPLTVKTPPPYDTAIINVQNNAQTSSNLYPSLHPYVSCATPPFHINKETVLMQNTAEPLMAWVHEGPRIILKPATTRD